MTKLTFKKKAYFLKNWLMVWNVSTQKFYIWSKIHKENNQGRSLNSIQLTDHHLQPPVREIPLYVKYTNDFINKINNFPVSPNSLLGTMDVKSLHTNIPINKGIASVKKKFDHYPKKAIPTKIVTTFLSLIQALNNFTFNLKFYR